MAWRGNGDVFLFLYLFISLKTALAKAALFSFGGDLLRNEEEEEDEEEDGRAEQPRGPAC